MTATRDKLFENYIVRRRPFYLFALRSRNHVVETVFPRQLAQISVNVDYNKNIIETTAVVRRAVLPFAGPLSDKLGIENVFHDDMLYYYYIAIHNIPWCVCIYVMC